MTLRRVLCVILAVAGGLGLCALRAAASDGGTDSPSESQLPYILYMLVWLMPLGIALAAVGVGDPGRAHQVATSLPLALVAALGGYALCGFAFQFGGVGLITDSPGLSSFIAEWSPLDLALGPGWGLMGLDGFALPSHLMTEEALQLFVSQLALVTTATLIPLITLSGRIPRLPSLFLALLISCVSYPLLGNWLWGGGWLSQLSQTLHLGYGYVDYGFSSLHLLGGGAALAALLAFGRRRVPEPQRPELPASYLPLNVLAGAFLALVGWLVMILTQPLVPLPGSAAWLILKALAAVAASTLGTFFYGWLVRGEPDPGLTGRGIIAALVAIGAPLPFVPLWAAALIGGLAGIALAPAMYLVEHVLGLDDRGAVVSIHGLAALWGLLAVGLFADGSQGAGWNIPGAQGASTMLSQGVTGYLAASGGTQGLAQLYAQLIGVGAIVLIATLVPWALLALAAQAYALPPTVRARALARAARLRQQREAREILKRRGGGLGVWPKARTAYLGVIAFSNRRLARRSRPSAPEHAPSQTHHSLPRRRLISYTGKRRPAKALRGRSLRSSPS